MRKTSFVLMSVLVLFFAGIASAIPTGLTVGVQAADPAAAIINSYTDHTPDVLGRAYLFRETTNVKVRSYVQTFTADNDIAMTGAALRLSSLDNSQSPAANKGPMQNVDGEYFNVLVYQFTDLNDTVLATPIASVTGQIPVGYQSPSTPGEYGIAKMRDWITFSFDSVVVNLTAGGVYGLEFDWIGDNAARKMSISLDLNEANGAPDNWDTYAAGNGWKHFNDGALANNVGKDIEFAITPEPATLLILGLGTMLIRKKK